MDETIIRRRLVTNESVTASLGPKRVASDFVSFLGALKTSQGAPVGIGSTTATTTTSPSSSTSSLLPPENLSIDALTTRAHEKLQATLTQYDFSVSRLDVVAERCNEDMLYYRTLEADILTQTEATQEEIRQLTVELETAKLSRQQRTEYEKLAKEVNKRPSRDAFTAQLAAVEADYNAAVQERQVLHQKLEKRRTQFEAIAAAIANVGIAVKEEAAEEKRLADEAIHAAALEADARRAEMMLASGAGGGVDGEGEGEGEEEEEDGGGAAGGAEAGAEGEDGEGDAAGGDGNENSNSADGTGDGSMETGDVIEEGVEGNVGPSVEVEVKSDENMNLTA